MSTRRRNQYERWRIQPRVAPPSSEMSCDDEELEEQVKPEETHPDPMHRGTNREAVLRCLLRCQAPEGFPQVIAVQVHSSRLE